MTNYQNMDRGGQLRGVPCPHGLPAGLPLLRHRKGPPAGACQLAYNLPGIAPEICRRAPAAADQRKEKPRAADRGRLPGPSGSWKGLTSSGDLQAGAPAAFRIRASSGREPCATHAIEYEKAPILLDFMLEVTICYFRK